MNTSYFAKYKGENAISISLSTPSWFKGTQYKKLAPSWNLLNGYKNGAISKEKYTEIYKREVLDKLDPKQVYEELGENTVLMCWEKSSDFCHRHIVSQWFNEKLGIEVKEL
jgi:uncharacterized protein (DUF488 family)